MVEAIAAAFGGLGMFFAGMYFLKENLKKLTNRRFKQLVANWTRRPASGVALGIAAGGIMQSTTAVTFILASMIASGLLTIAAALPIVIGANIGATFLVLLASLDVRILVLFLLGVTGLSFTFERLANFRTVSAAVFGVALVFFGLKMLQTGVIPLTQEPWFTQLLSLAGASYLLPLLVAIVLTVLAQSAGSVVLITIALAAAGGLTFEQAMMAIYGANLGSSCQSLLLSSHLRGRPKQMVMFEVLFNACAAVVLVILFFVEQYGDIPLVEALAKSLASRPALQLALIEVIFNVVGAILMLSIRRWVETFLARRFPTLPDEDDSRPAFILDEAIQEPETALDLAQLEQGRLASYLPRWLETARARSRTGLADLDRQNQSFIALAGTLRDFLRGLRDAPLDLRGYDRLNDSINRQRLLDGLNETIVELARTSLRTDDDSLTRQLLDNVIEGLDAVLLTMVAALNERSVEDRALFYAVTRSRGDVMQRLRADYLVADAELSLAHKGTVLIVTNLAERALWLLGQLADQEQLPDDEPVAILRPT